MMKRILAVLALVVTPVVALAQTPKSDVLLAPDGTLYTVESIFSKDAAAQNTSSQFLTLTVQQGPRTVAATVPGSTTGGVHASPALAFDPDSNTLFIFWEQALNNKQSTRLLFCSYQSGRFSATTELESANWRLRHNLRIGVTRRTENRDLDGRPMVNELTVHAIWWEETGYGEWARYAMLAMDKGNVSQIQIRDLSTFARWAPAYTVPADFDTNVLRHPQIFESPAHDSVDVVFGDLTTNGFHRITLRPVVDSRVRIPVGVRDQVFGPPTLRAESNAQSSPVDYSALTGDNDRLVLYTADSVQLRYLIFKDAVWSGMRTIALSEKVSADVAVNALRRMLASE